LERFHPSIWRRATAAVEFFQDTGPRVTINPHSGRIKSLERPFGSFAGRHVLGSVPELSGLNVDFWILIAVIFSV